MHIRLHTLIWAMLLAFLCTSPASTWAQQDNDLDGIDDSLERQLLDRFRPVWISNSFLTGPTSGHGVPVSAAWFLDNSRIRVLARPPALGLPPVDLIYASTPTAEQAIQQFLPAIYNSTWTGIPEIGGGQVYLSFVSSDTAWGFSEFDPTSWPNAVARNDAVYGRVWRPWADFPAIYSVQYYMLLTRSETDAAGGIGSHDGDWICIDLTVDTVRWGSPAIINAIYHNHGKQIFTTPDGMDFTADGRPIVYLENRVNEIWPNASTERGYAGWPRRNGFAKNWLWEEAFGLQDEEAVSPPHSGAGNVYDTRPGDFHLPNLGEIGPIGGVEPIQSFGPNATRMIYTPQSNARYWDILFVLCYPGRWGASGTSDPFGFGSDVSPPQGPASQSQAKVWFRRFTVSGGGTYGGPSPSEVPSPFSPAQHPYLFNLDIAQRFTSSWGDSDNGYFYFVNSEGFTFLPVAYVMPNASTAGFGLRSSPMRFSAAIQRVGTRGTVLMWTGVYSGQGTYSRPMEIRVDGGPVDIR